MYRETHKKGDDFATPEAAQKYDEIRDVMEKDPSLSQMEVAQQVFNSKSRSHVLGLGGVIKVKDIRGPYSSRAELEVELSAARRNNEVLTNRLATVEEENEKLQSRVESVEMKLTKDFIRVLSIVVEDNSWPIG